MRYFLKIICVLLKSCRMLLEPQGHYNPHFLYSIMIVPFTEFLKEIIIQYTQINFLLEYRNNTNCEKLKYFPCYIMQPTESVIRRILMFYSNSSFYSVKISRKINRHKIWKYFYNSIFHSISIWYS